jgi:1,4-Dihydroxy-2-naphthoate synthase (EC 4.1.3.36)
MVSTLFNPDAWTPVDGVDFDDVTYHRSVDHGTVRIAFDRPEVLNAFRPPTVDELYQALDHARQSADVGCVLLTGNGPSEKHGKWAFSSGGDQRIRGTDGYQYEDDEGAPDATRPGASTSWRCSASSASCPRWWSPWCRGGPWAAATACT